ncbi:hypothetical protein SUGI_0678740 [Cryptomeria japonica]|nr:hypothetical protein SUGI_0678740 [Cryptomeria japonica]
MESGSGSGTRARVSSGEDSAGETDGEDGDGSADKAGAVVADAGLPWVWVVVVASLGPCSTGRRSLLLSDLLDHYGGSIVGDLGVFFDVDGAGESAFSATSVEGKGVHVVESVGLDEAGLVRSCAWWCAPLRLATQPGWLGFLAPLLGSVVLLQRGCFCCLRAWCGMICCIFWKALPLIWDLVEFLHLGFS